MTTGNSRGALLFRVNREASSIFLGVKILSRLVFLDLVFCLFMLFCAYFAYDFCQRIYIIGPNCQKLRHPLT